MKIELIVKAIDAVPAVIPYLSDQARYIYAIGKPTEYKTYDYMLAQIEGLVRGLYSNNVGGNFIDIMANLISGQLTQAYRQAFEDEGYTDYFLPDYLQTSLTEMVVNQYTFVDQYYRDIIDARIDGTPINPLLSRAQLWAQRWTEAYNEAVRLITEHDGGNLIWRLGATEEHCPECAKLNGIVARATEWNISGFKPQNAPNDALTCGGWRCDCTLTPTDKRRSPKALDTLMNIRLSK